MLLLLLLLLKSFQSTHPRRVRHYYKSQEAEYEIFQSTHPRRVRLSRKAPVCSSGFISIHAPAKGATCPIVVIYKKSTYFNPRTREGCDVYVDDIQVQDLDFNPRTREGCDKWHSIFGVNCRCISIHAPAKGATTISHFFFLLVVGISIHAPAKGATNCKQVETLEQFYFNPRTREGCDVRNSQRTTWM